MPDTKRISVRCDRGGAEGDSQVFVAGEALGECTVIAVDLSRKRATAVVKPVEPRSYVCFRGGAPTCE